MKKRLLVCGMILFGLSAFFFRDNKIVHAGVLRQPKSLTLYDAASGAIPNLSLMSFADFPFGEITPVYSENATVLDATLHGNESLAGWVSSTATTVGFPILDPKDGVQVNFTVQVESESHTRDTRSGFSVIVLDKDKKGIELSFGMNEIWAKSDDRTGGLFTRGEDVTFATTDMMEYQVTLNGDTYILAAKTQPLLSGPLRDYTAFDGFPDPYETPNFLFLGDNTTSAQARVRLRFVSITGSQPVTPTSTVDSSQPTLSFTPLPQASIVPLQTPARTQPVVNLCPSGWLVAVVAMAGIFMSRKIR